MWKLFQEFLSRSQIEAISEDVILQFLSYHFHEKRRAPATMTVYLAALQDLLKYGFDFSIETRLIDLLKRSFFNQRPPTRRPRPFLSLHRVLNLLSSQEYGDGGTISILLHKTVFLIALATGARAPQLFALSRCKEWTKYGEDGSVVTLAPLPGFLTKNERVDNVLQPTSIPARTTQEGPHTLCPVNNLKKYIENTNYIKEDYLFAWPGSGLRCSKRHIAVILKR